MSDDSRLEPQAALETAVRDVIRRELGLSASQCGRTFDERPPATAGRIFVAVWSPGKSSPGAGGRTALDRLLGVAVTVAVRADPPADRLVEARDDAERLLNRVVALVHRDSYDGSIVGAANALAGLRPAYDPPPPPPSRRVGFCEGLAWEATGEAIEVAADFYRGSARFGATAAGVVQTATFSRARHVQSQLTAR